MLSCATGILNEYSFPPIYVQKVPQFFTGRNLSPPGIGIEAPGLSMALPFILDIPYKGWVK